MKYKIVATDLDGTLIGSDLKLSEENRKAIKELSEKGVLVVPATGRAVSAIDSDYILPEMKYIISTNGAAVFDRQTGGKIFCGLSKELAAFVMSVVFKYDTHTIVHKDGNIYGDIKKASEYEKYHMNSSVVDVLTKSCVFVEGFEETILSEGDVEGVSSFFANEEDVKKCREELSANVDLSIVEGWNCNLEIFYKKAGKGNALELLAENLGLKMENVISVGDSDNDVQMVSMSGVGLATANACEKLKMVADEVICTNDEHVMEYILNKYFFE